MTSGPTKPVMRISSSPIPSPLLSLPSTPVVPKKDDADTPIVKEARPDTEAILNDLIAGKYDNDGQFAPVARKVKGFQSWSIETQEIDPDRPKEAVHFGGPVMVDRGFVLHQPLGEWNSTLKIDDDTGLTTSKDVLEAMANGGGPSRALVTLGYAGWAPGQLEDEIRRNGWLTVEAKASLIFDLPADARVVAAMGLLGLNYGNLSDIAGHA